MIRTQMIAVAGALTLGLGLAGTAQAETMTYKSSLTAAQETPPNSTAGKGDLTATYDTSSKLLSWTVNYSGLSGPATAAHFHGPAGPGKAAGVEVPAPVSPSPIKGSATLTDAQAKDLTDGMMYFNIHTAENKGGEIRGQVAK